MEERTDLIEGEELEERPQRRREGAGALGSILLPVISLLVIVGGLWYWDSRDGSGGGSGDDGLGVVELPVDKNHTGEAASAAVGRAGPDFVLEMPEGGTLRLSDLQGQAAVLNFWATWCPALPEGDAGACGGLRT